LPNIKAAIKWVRQSEKRTTKNKDVKSRLKTIFKKAVASQETEARQNVESQLDRAAKNGIIHKNKAARKKSRLAKAIARAAAAPKVAEKKPTRKAAAKK
jgi:small subunit ribosomal protein S20